MASKNYKFSLSPNALRVSQSPAAAPAPRASGRLSSGEPNFCPDQAPPTGGVLDFLNTAH